MVNDTSSRQQPELNALIYNGKNKVLLSLDNIMNGNVATLTHWLKAISSSDVYSSCITRLDAMAESCP